MLQSTYKLELSQGHFLCKDNIIYKVYLGKYSSEIRPPWTHQISYRSISLLLFNFVDDKILSAINWH